MSKKKSKEELMEKDKDIELETTGDDFPEDKQLESEQESGTDNMAAFEADAAEWKDKYLRCMADFDNYRKRTLEEKSDWIKRASEKLALSICDVLDNFDRALMQLNEELKEDSFIKGIILIDQQLQNALERDGVKRIEALGQDFDPRLHEALAHIPSGYEEGKIAAIIQNGYLMNDKLIRPVRVAVSSGKEETNNKE